MKKEATSLMISQESDWKARGTRFDTQPSHILLWKLFIKSFLKPFSPPLIQEGRLSVTGKSMGT